jgi:hypothetical protein
LCIARKAARLLGGRAVEEELGRRRGRSEGKGEREEEEVEASLSTYKTVNESYEVNSPLS